MFLKEFFEKLEQKHEKFTQHAELNIDVQLYQGSRFPDFYLNVHLLSYSAYTSIESSEKALPICTVSSCYCNGAGSYENVYRDAPY